MESTRHRTIRTATAPSITRSSMCTARCRRRRADLGGGRPRAARGGPGRDIGEAMTSQATSAARVDPWHRTAARAETAVEPPGSLRGRPPQRQNRGGVLKLTHESPLRRPTSVAGSYAAKIASASANTATSRTTRGSSSWSSLRERTGGSAGKPGCLRARRRASIVAFELLRIMEHLVQRC